MATRRPLLFLLVGVFASLGAKYQTTNFVVQAPNAQVAQQIGVAAEQYRREKALEWLGREMPPWPEPCPLKVTLLPGGAGGATSFAFDRGQVFGQSMSIEGPLDRLVASVLPHEVTHTVFAHHFRRPVPRWADEGGSVLSEDDIERNRHDGLVRQILNTPGRAMPLRRLFSLREYPNDVLVLYAQGYSVANFLVSSSSKAAFLTFVGHGMQHGWDSAVQTHYRYRSVEELEQAWLTHLKNTKRPPAQLAQNTAPARTDLTNRVVVRQTAPPAQPSFDVPAATFRGQSPGGDQEIQRFGDGPNPPASGRPGYLPDYYPSAGPTSAPRTMPPATLLPPDRWNSAPNAGPSSRPPVVQLGPPQ